MTYTDTSSPGVGHRAQSGRVATRLNGRTLAVRSDAEPSAKEHGVDPQPSLPHKSGQGIGLPDQIHGPRQVVAVQPALGVPDDHATGDAHRLPVDHVAFGSRGLQHSGHALAIIGRHGAVAMRGEVALEPVSAEAEDSAVFFGLQGLDACLAYGPLSVRLLLAIWRNERDVPVLLDTEPGPSGHSLTVGHEVVVEREAADHARLPRIWVWRAEYVALGRMDDRVGSVSARTGSDGHKVAALCDLGSTLRVTLNGIEEVEEVLHGPLAGLRVGLDLGHFRFWPWFVARSGEGEQLLVTDTSRIDRIFPGET